MTSNKPLIRAAVSIIFGAIISVAATPAFATYLTNSDGVTFWHTERPFVSLPVPEERGRHVGSVDMAQTTVGTTPKIGSTDNQIIGPAETKVLGPTDSQIIGPVDNQVIGPAETKIIGPIDSKAIAPLDMPAIIPIQ